MTDKGRIAVCDYTTSCWRGVVYEVELRGRVYHYCRRHFPRTLLPEPDLEPDLATLRGQIGAAFGDQLPPTLESHISKTSDD